MNGMSRSFSFAHTSDVVLPSCKAWSITAAVKVPRLGLVHGILQRARNDDLGTGGLEDIRDVERDQRLVLNDQQKTSSEGLHAQRLQRCLMALLALALQHGSPMPRGDLPYTTAQAVGVKIFS
jgi:hypothetical protein